MTVAELQRKRAEVNQKAQALAALPTMTAEQEQEFDTLSAEFDQMGKGIERLQKAEQMNADAAQPIKASQLHGGDGSTGKPLKQYQGDKFARFAMSIAAGEGNIDKACTFAEKQIGDSQVVAALDTSTGSGGALVPEEWADDVIELLRPQTVVLELGARPLPVDGEMNLPRLKGGATAHYVGENKDATASNQSTDNVKLDPKEIIAMVPIANKLIGRSGYATEQLVLDDMVFAMAGRSDVAYLRGDGSGDTPTGIRYQVPAGNLLPWSGTVDLATVDAYLDAMILKARLANSRMIKPAWALNPRTFMFLFGLRDANGNKVYPEMEKGLLKGYPVRDTTSIPLNLGVGGNESEIYFGDFYDILIGHSSEIAIDFSKEATYLDSSNNLVSAFSKNQSLIKVTSGNDLACRHPESLVVGIGVTF